MLSGKTKNKVEKEKGELIQEINWNVQESTALQTKKITINRANTNSC